MIDSNFIILDFGCGRNKVKGSIGVDKVNLENVDVQHDLICFPYPFDSNSADKIYCRHVLEHFDADLRNKILGEMYRILKRGGQLEIRVPHVFSVGAFHDPTHKSFFTFNTMDYFTENHPFSYYNEFFFKIIKRWANVYIFYSASPPSKLVKILNNLCSMILNKFMKISSTIPDLLVKLCPFYFVEIFWVLEK